MTTYSKDHLPGDPDSWPEFVKVRRTKATRVSGPFTVQTREGTLTCENGYIALDSAGYPYPVDYDEFWAIYELADDD